MALNSLICADVPLRNCSLTHSYRHTVDADMWCSSESRVIASCCSDAKDKVLYTFCSLLVKKYDRQNWRAWFWTCMQCVAFNEVHAQAPIHFVVISKRSIGPMSHRDEADKQVDIILHVL